MSEHSAGGPPPPPAAPPLGDMDAAAFRQAGHELVDWIARYLEEAERYPVLSRVKPGEVRGALPPEAPPAGKDLTIQTVLILRRIMRICILG